MTRWSAFARRPEKRWLESAPQRPCLPANPLNLGAWLASLGLFLSWPGLAVLYGELIFRLRRYRRRLGLRELLHTEAAT